MRLELNIYGYGWVVEVDYRLFVDFSRLKFELRTKVKEGVTQEERFKGSDLWLLFLEYSTEPQKRNRVWDVDWVVVYNEWNGTFP